jgi:hypothetical protein
MNIVNKNYKKNLFIRAYNAAMHGKSIKLGSISPKVRKIAQSGYTHGLAAQKAIING